MLVEKTAQCPHKTSPKPAQKIQTSPNYSPIFAIKLTVCSESSHHYLIGVADFVQHTTDLSYKANSNIQNSNGSNIATTIKLSLTYHTLQSK